MTWAAPRPWINNSHTPWLLLCAAAMGVMLWMGSHPVELPSDDALFFSRGLDRFSVLEFSPHFPGYPGLVLLGRLIKTITGDAVHALFWLSVVSAGLCPLAAAAAAHRYGAKAWAACCAGLALLTSPLLPAMGLSLLSDAPGLLFLLLALIPRRLIPHPSEPDSLGCGWRTERPRAYASESLGCGGSRTATECNGDRFRSPRHGMSWAGILLGCAVIIRPSNAPLILPLLILRPGLIPGLCAIALPSLGGILLLEGWPYVDEGIRFLSGHSTVWGNTILQTDAPHWWSAITDSPGGLAMATLTLWMLRGLRQPLTITALCGLLWVLAMQNPQNLRHLAPIIALACIAAAPRNPRPHLLLIIVNLYAHHIGTDPQPHRSPLGEQIASLQQAPPGLVISNYGIAVLRQSLPQHRIMDAFYQDDCRFAQSTTSQPVYILRSQRNQGRMMGENGLSQQPHRE